MNRIVLGAVSALLLAASGLFWWQGRAETDKGAPLPAIPAPVETGDAIPFADAHGLRGPVPPELDEVTREQRRFDRLDRDRDSRITANEMLAPRVAAFRKMDVDHNNLLTFQEWSVRTSTRFTAADGNRDGILTRDEFRATKPKRGKHPDCQCAAPRPKASARRGHPAEPPQPDAESGGDEGEPAN